MQTNTDPKSTIDIAKKAIALLRFELGNRLKAAEAFVEGKNAQFELEVTHPTGAKVSVQGILLNKEGAPFTFFLKSMMGNQGRVNGVQADGGTPSFEARAQAIVNKVMDMVGRIEH